MNITRRSFVRLSGMTAVSTMLLDPVSKAFGQVVSDAGLHRLPVESTTDPLNYLLKAHFEPFIGTGFKAGIEGTRTSTFRLLAVTDLSRDHNTKRGVGGESYSLLFTNASKERPVSGLYVFDHGNLGRFTLMLSPVGKSGKNFEAVINRTGK